MTAMAHRSPPVSKNRQIAVMVVDDSAVIRGLITKWINEDPDLVLVASAANGDTALAEQKKTSPDVVVLDINMPGTDGMKALPLLLKQDPDVKIIMASSLTKKGAKVSVEAMALGAADFIEKPSGRDGRNDRDVYRKNLLEKIVALASSRRRKPRDETKPITPIGERAKMSVRPEGSSYGRAPITLKKFNRGTADVIAIGSSTGGPQALSTVLKEICSKTDYPVLITQHMPQTFTGIFAQHLDRELSHTCTEAKHGEPIQRGHVYLAPGDYHMVVSPGAQPVIRLNQEKPENFCRPSVDPMFRSIAKVYGKRCVAAILTGMGHDGLNGSAALASVGANIIAQDEATSVVWGMPGAVATGGVCCAVLPLPDIGRALIDMARGKLP